MLKDILLKCRITCKDLRLFVLIHFFINETLQILVSYLELHSLIIIESSLVIFLAIHIAHITIWLQMVDFVVSFAFM